MKSRSRIMPKQMPALFGKQAYQAKVIAMEPIGYWPLDETSGATAYDRSGNARNGSYQGTPALANAAGPDGVPVPYFDAVNDCVSLYSTSLRDAISWAEGSMAIWSRLEALDAQTRVQLMFYSGSNDYVEMNKTANASGEYQWLHKINGVTKQELGDAGGVYASLAWRHFGFTWSVAADQAICYFQGVQAPGTVTMTGLGTTAVALLSSAAIGRIAYTTAQYWKGWLCHAALWARCLAPAEMARLAQT